MELFMTNPQKTLLYQVPDREFGHKLTKTQFVALVSLRHSIRDVSLLYIPPLYQVRSSDIVILPPPPKYLG
jgi:hypothetical protein